MTRSAVYTIHGFGKVKILKKAVSFHEEGHLASLLSVRVSTNEVIEAGLSLFQHIYGDKTKALETLRFLSYSRMIAKKKLNPSRLPPATSSATEHILRSYLQYHNWVTLDTASLNPLHYGWEMSSEGYYDTTGQSLLKLRLPRQGCSTSFAAIARWRLRTLVST